MFGGVGKLVVVLVLRGLQARQRLSGIGLSPKRRLLLPLAMIVLGLIGIPAHTGAIVSSHAWIVVVPALLVALGGGALRAGVARLSSVPASELYPGGVRATDGWAGLGTDIAVMVVTAALIIPLFASAGGLHAAVSVWTIVVALSEFAAYGVLLARAGGLRAARVAR